MRLSWPLPDGLGDWGVPSKNVKGVAISELFTEEGEFGELQYDFGDSWYVGVKLEKLKVDEGVSVEDLPCVVKGKGFGVVEDCGGVWGLEEIAQGLKTGQGEDWEDRKEWLKERYPEVLEKGLEFFDIDEVNVAVKSGGVADIYKLMSK